MRQTALYFSKQRSDAFDVIASLPARSRYGKGRGVSNAGGMAARGNLLLEESGQKTSLLLL